MTARTIRKAGWAAAGLVAMAALIGLAGPDSPGLGAPGKAAPAAPAAPASPAAQPSQPAPVKVESPEQATSLLDDMIKEIALGLDSKLDFESAKANFEKLQAVKPFAENLDDKRKILYWQGLAGVGLLAGEPAAALEGCRQLLKGEEKDPWAARGFLAAGFLGDDKTGREMLAKMASQKAMALAMLNMSVGRRVPEMNLPLLDGKVFHWGNDKVVVADMWGVNVPDVYAPVLPTVKALNEKYKKNGNFILLGVNLNTADLKDVVKKYIRDNDMRWLHFCEGKAPEANELANKVFGTGNKVCTIVVGPDRRVLFCGQPGDTAVLFAINTGLRQIEKKQPKPKVEKPDRPPVATQPKSPATTRPAAPLPAASGDKADQMLSLAETYKAAGMADKANELLRQLVEQFPDSSAAAKAREALGGKSPVP